MRIEEAFEARLREIVADAGVPIRAFSLRPDEEHGICFMFSHGGMTDEYGDYCAEVSDATVQLVIQSRDAGWIFDTAHRIRLGLFTDQRDKRTWPLAGDTRRSVSLAKPMDGGAQGIDEKADLFVEVIKFGVTYDATGSGLVTG